MKKHLILFAALVIIFLGGCSRIYQINDKPVNYPKVTRSSVSYIDDNADLSKIAWWGKLNSPELNQLISKALRSNNKIKSSYATIEQAQAQLKSAQYAWLPTFNASANGFTGGTWNTHATQGPVPATNPFFANFSNQRFHGYYTGFAPQYNLNILANISNVKAAKGALAVEQAQSQLTKLGIISQMSGTYFMLISQREQLLAEKTLISDYKKLRQLERVRYAKGASNIETVINVSQQIAQEDVKIPQIESVIAQSENTIHLLLNQNPGPVITHRRLYSFNVNKLIPKNLPSSVLKNRPDIMIALNNVKIACAQVGIAYSAFFPSLSLTSLLGNASIDLRNLLKLSTNLWVVEASGVTKILDASSYQNIKAARADFKATYYNYLETLRSSFADVDNNLTNTYKNKLAYLQTEKAYKAAQKAYSIALTQYKAGATDYRNVMNFKINLDKSQLSLIQEKAQLLDNIVQVYNAVAGGYDAP